MNTTPTPDPAIAFAIEYLQGLVGTDPDGWDKPMSEDEMEQFMAFNNSDRSIEEVSFSK